MANYLTAWRAAPQILCPMVFCGLLCPTPIFCGYISFSPLPPISLFFSSPSSSPHLLPTQGFTVSFVPTQRRFRACQKQEGRFTIKTEIESTLILHSLCLLLINFGPFSTPPTESLWGKQASACGKLKFLHISIISRCPQLLTFPHTSNVIFLHSPYLRIFSFRL